ncbi:gag-polyprotein putative aspartyl protease domain-containing protein [Trichoderma breve]|uniref:Gag-polyprotein putative aspartyl protease domain-containing protein n=1 Tax=Trichoderma breve TaxID=2034170 RepID=A0A9W9B357_9HYPO|nr:gag-polyprotein putative aspartyl protease domain-containing protein [Trichoderma breve]KAJ4854429.1 gag-polyprotein putative aspartyl protease domain-containing protein [Trichoderma breve]
MSARMRSHNILDQLTQKLLNRRIYQEYPLVDSADKQYYVAGTVNGMLIEALPDTGADKCFISSELASRLGLLPVPGTQEKITLANEKVVESPGMVQVPWEFAKQREKHMINCWILPGCIRDLVLGSSFLQATNTLKKFRDRIQVRLLGVFNRFSLSFLGGKKQRLRGYINGHLTAALPDTGSDAMFINGAFARKIGLDIDSDVRNLVEVELADGSTTMTSGIVRDVQWKVGKTTVQCTFHVLEDLCMDVVLSNSYLFNMNIFSEQEEHFFDMDSKDHFDDDSSYFCNLRLLKNKNGKRANHYLEFYLIDAVASPKAFSPEMTQHELEQLEKWEKMEELYRRDESRDWIMSLPEEQQEKASQDEKARQQCWEASRKERKAKWAAASHTAKENVRNDTDLISRLKKRFCIGTPLRK